MSHNIPSWRCLIILHYRNVFLLDILYQQYSTFPQKPKPEQTGFNSLLQTSWVASGYRFLSQLCDRSKSVVFYRLDCDFLGGGEGKKKKCLTTLHIEGVEASLCAMHIILQTYLNSMKNTLSKSIKSAGPGNQNDNGVIDQTQIIPFITSWRLNTI